MHFPLKVYTVFLFICTLFLSCKRSNFEVLEFKPISNFNNKINDSTFLISADLNNSVLYGVQIPSVIQLPYGKFIFEIIKIEFGFETQNIYSIIKFILARKIGKVDAKVKTFNIACTR